MFHTKEFGGPRSWTEVPHRHQGGGLGFFTHMGGPTLRNRVPHRIHGGPRVPRPEGGPGSQDFAECAQSNPRISKLFFFIRGSTCPVRGNLNRNPFNKDAG